MDCVEKVDGFQARWNVDTAVIIPTALEELSSVIEDNESIEPLDIERPTKWWLEVAHHYAKLLAERSLRTAGEWSREVSNVLVFSNAPEYAQADAPGAPPNARQAAAFAKAAFREVNG